MLTSSMLPWEWPGSWWNTLSLLQSLQLITFFHDLGRLPGLDALRTCPPFSSRRFKISKSHIKVTVLKLSPWQIVFTSELRIAKFSNRVVKVNVLCSDGLHWFVICNETLAPQRSWQVTQPQACAHDHDRVRALCNPDVCLILLDRL